MWSGNDNKSVRWLTLPTMYGCRAWKLRCDGDGISQELSLASLFIVIKQLDERVGGSEWRVGLCSPRRRTVGWFAGGRLARSAKHRPCLPAEISRDTDGGHYLTREVRASQKELNSQTSGGGASPTPTVDMSR